MATKADVERAKRVLTEFFLVSSEAKAKACLAKVGSVGTPHEVFGILRFIAMPWNWAFLLSMGFSKQGFRVERLRQLLKWTLSMVRNSSDFGWKVLLAKYSRRTLRDGMFLFESGESKSAILVFTGLANRPMLPTYVFLEAIKSPRSAKVFVHPKRGYQGGIEGVADTLEESVALIPQILKDEGLEVEWVIGTSAGGLPALMYSLTHGTQKTWILGANNPKFSSLGIDFMEFANGARSRLVTQELQVFVGEDSTEDIIAGYEISSQLRFSQPKVVRGAGHAPMGKVLRAL